MPTPFDSDIDLWLCAVRAAGRSPVTVAGCRHSWGHVLTWLDRQATGGTRRDALAYVERLRRTNEPSSVAHHVRGLRAGYAWLIREELLTGTNPFANLLVSGGDDRPTDITVTGIEAERNGPADLWDGTGTGISVARHDCGASARQGSAAEHRSATVRSGSSPARRAVR